MTISSHTYPAPTPRDLRLHNQEISPRQPLEAQDPTFRSTYRTDGTWIARGMLHHVRNELLDSGRHGAIGP